MVGKPPTMIGLKGCALLALVLGGACGGASTTPSPSPLALSPLAGDSDCPVEEKQTGDAPVGAASLAITHAALRKAGASDFLLTKLETDRFHYFRMLAEPFESRVCDEFAAQLPSLPVILVHGDAHIEQFVVTADAYGLEDFDRGGFGPAVLDLVRYAASIHVACSEAPWPCDADGVVRAFLDAYEAGLTREPPLGDPPAVVGRVRRRAPGSQLGWLDWTQTIATPLEPAFEREVRKNWARFSESLQQIQPDSAPSTYEIESIGGLSMGVGSAMERKLLLRAAGPTGNPDDDIVMEIREESAPPQQTCLWRPPNGESIQLMIIAVLSRRMPTHHGYVTISPMWRRAWVQAWDPGYAELELTDIKTSRELTELAVDAGSQLGGHLWNRFPPPLLKYQLFRQREASIQTRAQVEVLAKRLAEESIQAWTQFASEER